MDESTTTTAPQREVTITRTFDAPRELVYRAWVEPEQFAVWFGAELEVPLETLTMDVRPGGKWKATMLQEGGNLPFGGMFLEIDQPDRLVMTFDDPDNIGAGTNDDIQTLTVTFHELDIETTEVTLTQAGRMPDGMPEGLTQGYNSFMDKLAELLASA